MAPARRALTVLLVAGLAACASRRRNAVGAQDTADRAMRAFLDCAAAHADDVDDKQSDARTIALALTDRCGREYDAATNAWAAAHLSNDNQRRMFKQRRDATDARIEASLNIVLANRTGNLRRSTPR